jgi:hypothetical protein
MNADRRGHARVQGKLKEVLDVTYKTLRKHEGMEHENIWRELADEWKAYVRERKTDYIEMQTLTLQDGDVLASMGIECRFPWFTLNNRGCPLRAREEINPNADT